jgi:hypothetical protein
MLLQTGNNTGIEVPADVLDALAAVVLKLEA